MFIFKQKQLICSENYLLLVLGICARTFLHFIFETFFTKLFHFHIVCLRSIIFISVLNTSFLFEFPPPRILFKILQKALQNSLELLSIKKKKKIVKTCNQIIVLFFTLQLLVFKSNKKKSS